MGLSWHLALSFEEDSPGGQDQLPASGWLLLPVEVHKLPGFLKRYQQ